MMRKKGMLDQIVDVAEQLSVRAIEADLLRLAAGRIKEFGKDDREGVLLFLAAAKMRHLGNKVAEMEKAEQERNYKGRNEFK